MLRSLAIPAALATLTLAAFTAPQPALAQTWGQPVYLNPYGRTVGGSPLSEVETRSYAATGRRADGYSDRPQVFVPSPGYGRSWRHTASGRGGQPGEAGTTPTTGATATANPDTALIATAMALDDMTRRRVPVIATRGAMTTIVLGRQGYGGLTGAGRAERETAAAPMRIFTTADSAEIGPVRLNWTP